MQDSVSVFRILFQFLDGFDSWQDKEGDFVALGFILHFFHER